MSKLHEFLDEVEELSDAEYDPTIEKEFVSHMRKIPTVSEMVNWGIDPADAVSLHHKLERRNIKVEFNPAPDKLDKNNG